MRYRQIQLFTRPAIAAMRDRTKARNYSPEREEFRRDHARRRRWGLARRHAQKLCRLHGCSRECAEVGLHDHGEAAAPLIWPGEATGAQRPSTPALDRDVAPGVTCRRATRAPAEPSSPARRPPGIARELQRAPSLQAGPGAGRESSTQVRPGRKSTARRPDARPKSQHPRQRSIRNTSFGAACSTTTCIENPSRLSPEHKLIPEQGTNNSAAVENAGPRRARRRERKSAPGDKRPYPDISDALIVQGGA